LPAWRIGTPARVRVFGRLGCIIDCHRQQVGFDHSLDPHRECRFALEEATDPIA
jgi:hypothetical protein